MRIANGFPPIASLLASNDLSREEVVAAANSLTETVAEAGAQTLNLSETFASRRGIGVTRASLNLNVSATRVNSQNSLAARPDTDFDGQFVGVHGQTAPPHALLADVPAVVPKNGLTNDETIIYINGINTDKKRQFESLQSIADATGSRIIGIHNATQNNFLNVVQCLGDKLDIGRNPAVDTLANTVYNELRAGRDVHLLAHSQGGIITSRALRDVANRLRLEDNLSRAETERLLTHVKVETFGGAAQRYPDGPQYVHYINRRDAVPQAFGLRNRSNPFAQTGRGATTHYFTAGRGLLEHGLEEFYLPQRVPFEQARQGDFSK